MSNVRSAPIRKKSAVITQRQLDRSRPYFERYASWALLALSFLGSVVAFHGGDWAAIRTWQLRTDAVIGGVVLQSLCTYVEWSYRHRRFHPLYLFVLALDAGPTAIGYYPIVRGPLSYISGVIGLQGSQATTFVYVAVGIAALLLAWLPESRMIDD